MKRVILVFVALLMVSGGLFAQHRYDRGPRDVNRTRVHGYYSHTPRVHGGIYIGNGYDYGYDYTFANELYAMYGSEYRRFTAAAHSPGAGSARPHRDAHAIGCLRHLEDTSLFAD